MTDFNGASRTLLTIMGSCHVSVMMSHHAVLFFPYFFMESAKEPPNATSNADWNIALVVGIAVFSCSIILWFTYLDKVSLLTLTIHTLQYN